MKKNLLSIIILALVFVNMVMTAIVMFSTTGAMNKASKLMTDITTIVKLEKDADALGTGDNSINIEDIVVYDIADKMTITLFPGEDGKAHYYVTSISLSINKKHEDYKALYSQIEAKESIIKSIINECISSYTYEQALSGQALMKSNILKRIQDLFNSDFIYDVSFREYVIQ